MSEAKRAERTCAYQSVIRGKHLLVFRAYFPMFEMLSPPAGWSFLQISQWRPGQGDECWRIVYARESSDHASSL